MSLDEKTKIQTKIQVEMLRRELARRELLPFVQLINNESYTPGWVHKDLCAILDAFVDGVEQKLSPRLLIWMPPRSGKSTIVSRAFPPFLLGKHPDWEVVTASYGQDLSDEFGRVVRGVLLDPIYQSLFPKLAIDPSTQAADRIDTFEAGRGGALGRARGGYRAVGVGGSLTGRGANVLIVDDPNKDRAEADSKTVRESTWSWWTSVARTRLAPGGGAIVLQTRWHLEDLSGKLIEQARENPDADQWMVYSFPAIAEKDEMDWSGTILRRREGEALHPERFPVKALKAIKASIGERDWNALYQQRPVSDSGNYFRKEWLKLFQDSPE